MSEAPRRSRAIDRALADTSIGNRTEARTRLKGYIVNRPDSMEARRLLMELYRVDGYPDEAGRWGYLIQDGATPEERAAYEYACAHRLSPRWTATLIRKGLHWPASTEALDPSVARILEGLDGRAAREAEGWKIAIGFHPWLWVKAHFRPRK